MRLPCPRFISRCGRFYIDQPRTLTIFFTVQKKRKEKKKIGVLSALYLPGDVPGCALVNKLGSAPDLMGLQVGSWGSQTLKPRDPSIRV